MSKSDFSNIAVLLQELTGQTQTKAKDNIYNCPLHKNKTQTLHVRPNAYLPGGWELVCIHCGFHGGVIEFTAKVQDTGLGNAMRMFWPKGPLHGVFFEAGDPDMDKETLQCLLVNREKQLSMKDWLEKARLKFMNHSMGRQYLVGRGIREDMFHRLKPAVCCPQMPDDIILQVKKMAFEQTIVFPYYNGGDIAFLVFEDMIAAKRRYVLPSMKDIPGMFIPAPMPVNANRLIVAQTEIDAMLLYLKSEEIGTQDFYPICVSEVKGLDVAFNATEVILVSHSDKPLELKDTIRYSDYRLPVKVMDMAVPLRDIDSARLKSLSDKAKLLRDWHIDTITAYFNENGAAATTKMLSASGMPRTEKSEIIATMLARHCTNDVLLDIIRKAEPLHMIKTVGRTTVKRTINGYFQLQPTEKQLSNFMFQADNIVGIDKDMFVTGRAITPDFEQEMALPVAVLLSPARLNNHVWDEMVAAGRNFLPFAFQPACGLNWRHLVTMFDEPACVSERTLLGISKDFISYPEVRIRVSDGRMERAVVPDALKNRFCNMYGGIMPSTEKCDPVMRKLLASEDTAVTAFRELLGHVLYETVTASLKSGMYQPDHVIVPFQIPDSGNSLTVNRLASMFNGHSRLKTLTEEKELEAFGNDCARLNMLPVIFAIHGKIKITDCLQGLRNSSIILCPEIECSKRCSSEHVWFMSGSGADETVAPDILKAVVDVWPDMLVMARSLLIEHGCGDSQTDFKGSMLLSMFARKLDAAYNVPKMFSRRINKADAGVETVFRVLRHLVEKEFVTVAETEWKYKTEDRKTNVGYFAGDKLRIRPKALLSVVKELVSSISMVELEQCFRDMFAMTGKSGRGEYEISRSAWDEVLKLSPVIRIVTSEDLGLRKGG